MLEQIGLIRELQSCIALLSRMLPIDGKLPVREYILAAQESLANNHEKLERDLLTDARIAAHRAAALCDLISLAKYETALHDTATAAELITRDRSTFKPARDKLVSSMNTLRGYLANGNITQAKAYAESVYGTWSDDAASGNLTETFRNTVSALPDYVVLKNPDITGPELAARIIRTVRSMPDQIPGISRNDTKKE